MMARVSVFVDNAWLRSNMMRLANEYGIPKFRIDYGKLPQLLTKLVAEQIGCPNQELTRTYIFDSKPVKFDSQDIERAEKHLSFFERLRVDHAYDVELSPIDYKGRRLRAADRDPSDWFQPRQCCVDVALATEMVHCSALPDACDIVVPVVGDIDFVPALQRVRSLGKRVVVASIKGSCSTVLSQPIQQPVVRDGEIIWLNDHLSELELRYDRHRLACQSLRHTGDRMEYTAFHPRRGEKFYCERCRETHKKQKREGETLHAIAA